MAWSKVTEGSGPGKTRRQEAKASKKILPERFQNVCGELRVGDDRQAEHYMNKIKGESRIAHATWRSCMQKEAHRQPCSSAALLEAARSCLVPLRDPSAVNVNMRWRVKTYAAGKRARAAQGSLARCQRTLVRGPAHLKNMPVVALGYPTLSRFASVEKGTSKGHLYEYTPSAGMPSSLKTRPREPAKAVLLGLSQAGKGRLVIRRPRSLLSCDILRPQITYV